MLQTKLKNAILDNDLDVIRAYFDEVKMDAESLQCFLTYAIKLSKTPVVKVLLQYAADAKVDTDNTIKTNALFAINVYDDLHGLQAIEVLLSHGANPNGVDINGVTTAMRVVETYYNNQKLFFELLKKYNVDFNMQTDAGSALTTAMCNDRSRYLLSLPNINLEVKDSNGRTPLAIACLSNSEWIEDLVALKADVNTQDKDGMTPLMFIAQKNDFITHHANKAYLLLNNGAKVDIQNAVGEDAITIALHNKKIRYADMGVNYPMVDMLLEYGAQMPNMLVRDFLDMYNWQDAENVKNAWQQLNTAQKNGCFSKILTKVMLDESLELLQFFLTNGANPNFYDKNDADFIPPLIVACMKNNIKAVKMLLYYGAKADVSYTFLKDDVHYQQKKSAILVAAIHGTPEMISDLLEHGAQIEGLSKVVELNAPLENIEFILSHYNITDNQEEINYSFEKSKSLAVSKLLLSKGANSFTAALSYAVQHNASDDLVKFLAQNSDYKDTSEKNTNALDLALSSAILGNKSNYLQMMIDNGADIKKISYDLLDVAIKEGMFEVTKILLENGADVKKTQHGNPLVIALEDEQIEIAKLLREYGADTQSDEVHKTLNRLASKVVRSDSGLREVIRLGPFYTSFDNYMNSEEFLSINSRKFHDICNSNTPLSRIEKIWNNIPSILKKGYSSGLVGAVRNNNVDVVKFLLKQDEIDVHYRYGNDNVTAFTYIRTIEMAQLLLKQDSKHKIGLSDSLNSALYNNKFDLAKFLIEHGAALPNVPFFKHITGGGNDIEVVKLFIQYCKNSPYGEILIKDALLHVMTKPSNDHVKIIKLLIDNSSIEIVTPEVVGLAFSTGRIELIKYLVKQGVDFTNLNLCTFNSSFWAENNPSVVKFLIDNAPKFASNQELCSKMLISATASEYASIVKVLQQYCSVSDNALKDALHSAIRANCGLIIKNLIVYSDEKHLNSLVKQNINITSSHVAEILTMRGVDIFNAVFDHNNLVKLLRLYQNATIAKTMQIDEEKNKHNVELTRGFEDTSNVKYFSKLAPKVNDIDPHIEVLTISGIIDEKAFKNKLCYKLPDDSYGCWLATLNKTLALSKDEEKAEVVAHFCLEHYKATNDTSRFDFIKEMYSELRYLKHPMNLIASDILLHMLDMNFGEEEEMLKDYVHKWKESSHESPLSEFFSFLDMLHIKHSSSDVNNAFDERYFDDRTALEIIGKLCSELENT